MPIIPTTMEVEIGVLGFKASLGKVSGRPYLRNKTNAKRLGTVFKWYSICLSNMRP
jgi:hypothetical protein